jgi:hypothetical protein
MSAFGNAKTDRAIGVIALFLHITEVNYLHDYLVEVTFNNGRKGIADL